MSIEEKLISRSSPAEINQELQRELAAALELIKNYEAIIQDLQLENRNNLKNFTHDLSNPLQTLAMTIEFIQDRVPAEFRENLLRMKRSTDNMTEILHAMRKLRTNTASSVKSVATT